MSSALVIRIIGGVCGGAIGTYISGKIYDYINQKPQLPLPPPEPTKKFETKLENVKSFEAKLPLVEEILNIQIQEHIDNGNKNNYEYDNEHGNTVIIKNTKETVFVNDALYDNNYIDYYSLLFAYDNDNDS